MRSNRPVSRFRLDTNSSAPKAIDPRFAQYSGKLDEEKFNKHYSFLDDYRASDIYTLSKALKKEKNAAKKETISKELIKTKQQVKERRRALQAQQRLDSMKSEEREKIKQGKKPFFLKQSAKKEIILEEKFKDLKREGKLTKFMERKRRKNASKDKRWMPTARISTPTATTNTAAADVGSNTRPNKKRKFY